MGKLEAIQKSTYETLHEEIVKAHVLASNEFKHILADIVAQRAELDKKLHTLQVTEATEEHLEKAKQTLQEANTRSAQADKDIATKMKLVETASANTKQAKADIDTQYRKLTLERRNQEAAIDKRAQALVVKENSVAVRETACLEQETMLRKRADAVAKEELRVSELAKQISALVS